MDGSKSFFRFGSPSSCWVLHLFFSLGPFFDLLPSETFSVDMGPVSCPASSVASSPDYTILLRQPGVMNQFVHCDLSEFRAFVFKYAHHNPGMMPFNRFGTPSSPSEHLPRLGASECQMRLL